MESQRNETLVPVTGELHFILFTGYVTMTKLQVSTLSAAHFHASVPVMPCDSLFIGHPHVLDVIP